MCLFIIDGAKIQHYFIQYNICTYIHMLNKINLHKYNFQEIKFLDLNRHQQSHT
jgi:hypothetical protein